MNTNLNKLSYLEIKAFLSVFRYRKARIAATELGMSEVNVSRCLKVLRECTGDLLFIRKGYQLVPTQRAIELAPIFAEIEKQMQQAQEKFSDVDLSNSDRIFEIYAYDEFIWAIQEVIEQKIFPYAPRLRFNIHVAGNDYGKEVAEGKIDFLVTYEGFKQEDLKFERFSSPMTEYLLCRKGHPLTNATNLTTAELAKYPLVQIEYFKELSCPVFVELCRQDGLVMEIGSETESMSAALWKILHSDSVAIVCNQFTRHYVSYIPKLEIIEMPSALCTRITKIRCAARPIGNYLTYNGNPHNSVFNWVKNELVMGLRELWEKLESKTN